MRLLSILGLFLIDALFESRGSETFSRINRSTFFLLDKIDSNRIMGAYFNNWEVSRRRIS